MLGSNKIKNINIMKTNIFQQTSKKKTTLNLADFFVCLSNTRLIMVSIKIDS